MGTIPWCDPIHIPIFHNVNSENPVFAVVPETDCFETLHAMLVGKYIGHQKKKPMKIGLKDHTVQSCRARISALSVRDEV